MTMTTIRVVHAAIAAILILYTIYVVAYFGINISENHLDLLELRKLTTLDNIITLDSILESLPPDASAPVSNAISLLKETQKRSFRTVISLTTSPKRIWSLEATLTSLFNQDILPHAIQLNLPYVFLRGNESYPPIESIPILSNPLIRINRCEDMGPATKLIPTLYTETDPETMIIIVDDDTVYPHHMTRLMQDRMAMDPYYVQVGHCGDTLLTNPESEFQVDPFDKVHFTKGAGCCCRLHEGFGGVAYLRKFFNSPAFSFENYIKIALSNNHCFRSDDFVISNYLTILGIQGLDIGPYMTVRQQATGYGPDALHKLEVTGHPYPKCSMFLQKHNISKIRTWYDTIDPTSRRLRYARVV